MDLRGPSDYSGLPFVKGMRTPGVLEAVVVFPKLNIFLSFML